MILLLRASHSNGDATNSRTSASPAGGKVGLPARQVVEPVDNVADEEAERKEPPARLVHILGRVGPAPRGRRRRRTGGGGGGDSEEGGGYKSEHGLFENAKLIALVIKLNCLGILFHEVFCYTCQLARTV
jgi:hypothetical protein